MTNLIFTYLPYAAAVALTVFIICLYRAGLKKYAKQILLCFVSSAEQTYGAGTGKLKYSAVAARLYEVMPKPFKFIFSEKCISEMIETAVSEMKKYLCTSDKAEEERGDDA